MSVSVLIPYRPDRGTRDRIWSWLRSRYQTLFPDWEICVSDDRIGDGQFNRGEAVNLAAGRATGEVFVVGDADTAFNPLPLAAAVQAALVGGWFVPHTYHQLSRQQTEGLLAGDESIQIVATETDWTGVGSSVAPIVVVPAVAFREVGGYDERYLGWGSDDAALQVTLDTLYQPYGRWPGDAFHLWHPRTETHDSGSELTRRYLAAQGDRAAVLRLREGATSL